MILIPVPSNAFYRTFQGQKRPVISLFCRSKTGFSPDGHELITFSRNPDNHPDNTSLATPGTSDVVSMFPVLIATGAPGWGRCIHCKLSKEDTPRIFGTKVTSS
jgi:hypothetical protein